MRLLSRNWLVTFFAATYWIDTIYTKPTKVFSTPDLLHQRYDYGVDKHTLTKRSTGHIVTTGVHVGQGPGGSVPQRLEIRELEKDKTMWNLYILGLDMLQWTPQSDRLSWYQIMGQCREILVQVVRTKICSGIHGRPFLPYDGAVAVPGGEGHGYCSHVSVLLPIWHRPYLVFYEVS
jgi:tyrosinase